MLNNAEQWKHRLLISGPHLVLHLHLHLGFRFRLHVQILDTWGINRIVLQIVARLSV